MKKLPKVIVTLVLVLSMLSGCSALLENMPPQTVTCQELTITLPGYYEDWSNESWAAPLEFMFGYSSSAVVATKEGRAALEASLPDITVKDYAEMFVTSGGLTSEVAEKDGLVTFTYTMDADGTEFSYLCAVYASQENFWVVQTYCPTYDLETNQEKFMDILKSVTFETPSAQ